MTARLERWTGLASVIALTVLLAARPAAAEPRRYALVIGAATGEPDEEPLRFAEGDADRIAAILRDLGGFAPEDVVVMTSANAADVRRSLTTINTRIREANGDSLLLVFYSGHADAQALHLAGTRLPASELRDLVYSSPATARVMVIDACRSGAVTRTKGGRRAPPFKLDVDDRLRSKGVAIMTSSAEGEDSQESDELQASFFTHFLASGLRGAADSDADSRVTLAEAFRYASERTLAATARTSAGPQHPTYRFDLSGREDLVLTRIAAEGLRTGVLAFHEPGTYFVQQRTGRAPVAELEVPAGGRSLALPAGDYLVSQRASDHLLQRTISVVAARETEVRSAAMERIAYARIVRKGGTELRRSASGFVGTSVRSGFADVAAGIGVAGGVRVDLPMLSLELRLEHLWHGSLDPGNFKPVQGARTLGATAVALRAFDVGHWTLAAGAALGGLRVERTLGASGSDLPAQQLGISVGAIAQAQRQLVGRVYLRGELGALGYVFDPPPESSYEALVVFSASILAGAFF